MYTERLFPKNGAFEAFSYHIFWGIIKMKYHNFYGILKVSKYGGKYE